MVQHIQIKKMNEINDELSAISSQCERAFKAWIKDRSNTNLLKEYRELLSKRDIVIKEYKSCIIIN
ncbi:hypothetical protein ACNRWW_03115 [Metabacillus sp. HB246100]|uniref:hypothetical protein n=1 Tax=Bacillus weihaiensis TaxID=1547283 RepID=UPI0023566CBD|nr:hypothetical protein [Bacillus weihaiensis]